MRADASGTKTSSALPSGSGAKYQCRNETFWEHRGEAVMWGYIAPEMRCKKTP